MNCKGVIRELSDYIDGDLDPVIVKELERHLEHCEDCKMILDQTKQSIDIYCESKRGVAARRCAFSHSFLPARADARKTEIGIRLPGLWMAAPQALRVAIRLRYTIIDGRACRSSGLGGICFGLTVWAT